MLNDYSYYAFMMEKFKREEMLRNENNVRIAREAIINKRRMVKKAVITHILEGTGKALINTGNRLLKIA